MRMVSRPISETELTAAAIVFSPHEDDETLGCGGTILRKRAAGAPVRIVFMTDGAASHAPQLLPKDELARIREAEARRAAHVLGVDEGDLTFLRFADGALDAQREAAEAAVAAILEEHRPEQIFVPYRFDGLPDHVVTHQIVARAIDRVGAPVSVFSFPIWFWNHWPWMRASAMAPAYSRRRRLRRAASGAWRVLTAFRVRVALGDALEAKRRALGEHRSQVTRFDGRPEWFTLDDVAEGDFLPCLLRRNEYFHHERRGAGGASLASARG
jgi:LmbE family N-acetylglucosaminyl deacetylase